MEIFEENANDPLLRVDLQFEGSKISQKDLGVFLKKVKYSRSIAELHQSLVESVQKLGSLNTYSNCDITVYPNKSEDTALVNYQLKEFNWWGFAFNLYSSFEGGINCGSIVLRNLRNKADDTRFSVSYKHNTGLFDFSGAHYDQLFKVNQLQAFCQFGVFNTEIDQNITENKYGGIFSLMTLDGKHKFSLGRFTRTNLITPEYATAQLFNNELLVSSKTFFQHQFKIDTRDNPLYPSEGHLLTLDNQIAFGFDVQFHKVQINAQKWLRLYRECYLQGSMNLGFIVPWFFSKARINDRFHVNYIKGFTSVGDRNQSQLTGKYGVAGDHLGENSQLMSELKLCMYDVPVLSHIGMVPYLYANLILPGVFNTNIKLMDKSRSSIGLGIRWVTMLGKIDFNYSAKSFSKAGDVGTEFQVLFADQQLIMDIAEISVHEIIQKLINNACLKVQDRQITKQVPMWAVGQILSEIQGIFEMVYLRHEDKQRYIELDQEPIRPTIDSWARSAIRLKSKKIFMKFQETESTADQSKDIVEDQEPVKESIIQEITAIPLKIEQWSDEEDEQLRQHKAKEIRQKTIDKKNEEEYKKKSAEEIKRKEQSYKSVQKGRFTYDYKGDYIKIRRPIIDKLPSNLPELNHTIISQSLKQSKKKFVTLSPIRPVKQIPSSEKVWVRKHQNSQDCILTQIKLSPGVKLIKQRNKGPKKQRKVFQSVDIWNSIDITHEVGIKIQSTSQSVSPVKLNPISEFNKQIINSANWGLNPPNKTPILPKRLPKKVQYGSQTFNNNVFRPRDRLFISRNKKPINNSFN